MKIEHITINGRANNTAMVPNSSILNCVGATIDLDGEVTSYGCCGVCGAPIAPVPFLRDETHGLIVVRSMKIAGACTAVNV